MELLLQHCLVGNCPFPLFKVGHETVTVKVVAVALQMLLWKAAIQNRFPASSSMFTDLSPGLGLKSIAVLLTGSFRCSITTSSTITSCPSLPSVHTYHSVFLRNSRSQKSQSRETGRELPLTWHSLQMGASVRATLSHEGTWEMCYPLSTHELSMPDRVMQKRAVILGAKPSIFSQGVMLS